MKKIKIDLVGTDAEHALEGLGERLRYAREKRTLEEVSVFMGCNRISVSRYESGRQIPDAAYLLKYAELVNRSAAWLLTGIEVDETALSVKEQHYITLAKTTSCLLEKILQRNNLRLNWNSAGIVFSMLYKQAIILTHEGLVPYGDDEAIYAELEFQLEDYLQDLFRIVTTDIFLQSGDSN